MNYWNFILFLGFISSCNLNNGTGSEGLYLRGDNNYLSGYEAVNKDGTINVVIEIPAGSIQKWEVEMPSGELIWTMENGNPRVVNYLGYPGNYGMIPKTVLPKTQGGDGDPLDVLVLGPPVERGTVVKTKIIGVLKLLDRGEQDDKLIGVDLASNFEKVNSLEDLKNDFRGITEIIELWFANYKGQGKLQSKGFASKKEAIKILHESIEAYQK